jgi:hypothetical protein
MKTLVLLATTLSIVSLNVLPVSAEPQNTSAQPKTSRWFHVKKDIALKQEQRKEDKGATNATYGDLDYVSDSFIISE